MGNVDWSDLLQDGKMAGFNEKGGELPCSTKCEEFVHLLKYSLLKKNSALES
jgi:hypothetical protein